MSLDITALYDIMALREEVFTLEQRCNEKDLDGLDKNAVHIIGTLENNIIATARILPPNIYKPDKVSLGRFAIKKTFRGQGYGDELIQNILSYIRNNYPRTPIEFSAQFYLKSFYEKYGFVTKGEVFDEGGIQHIMMTDLDKQDKIT